MGTIRAQGSDQGGEGDLVSGIGSEIEVGIDRWSTGQISVSDVVVAVVVVAVAAVAAWIVRHLLSRAGDRVGGPAATAAVVGGQAASLAIYLFATGIVLEVLGFSLGPMITLVLVVVVAVLFLRPLVQNLSAGLLLQLRGPFRPGDVVETNHALGVVEEVNARTVVVVTNDGRTVYVPNRDVLDQVLVNHSSVGRRRSELSLLLAAGVDLTDAAQRVQRAVASLGTVLDEPPPDVLVTGFDGSRVCLDVRFWHPPQLSAENATRDGVARAVVDLLQTPELTLADPTVVVRSPAAADHEGEGS